MTCDSSAAASDGKQLIAADVRSTWAKRLGGVAVMMAFLLIPGIAFATDGELGFVAVPVGLFAAAAAHETIHLAVAWRITRLRPSCVREGLRAFGLVTNGITSRWEAQVILVAPAVLIPMAAVAASLVAGPPRWAYVAGTVILLLGSGSDLHYVRQLSTMSSCTLVEDSPQGYLTVASCSGCAGR